MDVVLKANIKVSCLFTFYRLASLGETASNPTALVPSLLKGNNENPLSAIPAQRQCWFE